MRFRHFQVSREQRRHVCYGYYSVPDIMEKMEESDKEHFGDLDLSLKEMQLAAINHIIGIDHQVSGLIESANRGIDGVLMIGICQTTKTCQGSSTRGVGSTTLAKAVYSRVSSQFDACCFLEDIAEAIAPHGGIRPLQFKLIHDIFGVVEIEDDTSYEDAFEVFKEVLHQMKVLIALDGVEDVSHITNFIGKELKSCLGLGSWIIVTSRGSNVITAPLGADLVIYKSVNLMERKVAVELFNWHAFGKEYFETECSEFVEPIVGKLLGCPLLIEFVGSLLHGEDVQAFEKLSKLQLTSDFWEEYQYFMES
ncbi:hypothetical protein MLD38_040835 [Melastoma candidum]|nr:hypothetical protein MLD38_040835 [Melastoma candidum]